MRARCAKHFDCDKLAVAREYRLRLLDKLKVHIKCCREATHERERQKIELSFQYDDFLHSLDSDTQYSPSLVTRSVFQHAGNHKPTIFGQSAKGATQLSECAHERSESLSNPKVADQQTQLGPSQLVPTQTPRIPMQDRADPSLPASRVCATRTPPAKTNKYAAKRAGAKAVKKIEQTSTAYRLSPEDATTFRALAARANYLSQDRADICFSTKELCREFAVPNRHSQDRLKRVCRYLAGKPRLVHNYNWGNKDIDDGFLEVYVDTDFAGCKETRRSTSGGVILLNGSNVRQWSKTQTTLALSSGEAELHGINAGITQGLGLQSLARDLGIELKVRVHSDATAALGMCRRRGLGKVRHLDVADLWAQQKVREGAIELVKVLGADNPADIMTKYVDRQLLERMLLKINMTTLTGRAACAPAAAGC